VGHGESDRRRKVGPRGGRPPTPDSPLPKAEVRPATLADLDAVVALRIALLREHAGNRVYGRLRADAPERARRLFAAQLESSHEVTLLAGRGETPVGILRCVDAAGSPLLHPARYAYVASVYVVPAERRAGVLRALMAAAEAWSRARGLGEMRLHNAADNPLAGAAWEALGFEVVEVLRVRKME
jgi:ribosomal protein S18 acetylase RimI-like enzyme